MKNTHKLLSMLLLAISFLAPVDAMKKRKVSDENVNENVLESREHKKQRSEQRKGLLPGEAQVIIDKLDQKRCVTIALALDEMLYTGIDDERDEPESVYYVVKSINLLPDEKALIDNLGRYDISHRFLKKVYELFSIRPDWSLRSFEMKRFRTIFPEKEAGKFLFKYVHQVEQYEANKLSTPHAMIPNYHPETGNALQTCLMAFILNCESFYYKDYFYAYIFCRFENQDQYGLFETIIRDYLARMLFPSSLNPNLDFPSNVPQTLIDPNLQDAYGCTALHYAVETKNFMAVEMLLSHPKINIDIEDYEERDRNGHVTYAPQTAYDYLPPENERDKKQHEIAQLFKNYVFKHRAYPKFFGNILK